MTIVRLMISLAIALGVPSAVEASSNSESAQCEGAMCADELGYRVKFEVCEALIPGYRVDDTKAGKITAFGKTEPYPSFLVLMPAQYAESLGFPTWQGETESGLAIATVRVVNGHVLADDHVLPKTALDHLTALCRKYGATTA